MAGALLGACRFRGAGLSAGAEVLASGETPSGAVFHRPRSQYSQRPRRSTHTFDVDLSPALATDLPRRLGLGWSGALSPLPIGRRSDKAHYGTPLAAANRC